MKLLDWCLGILYPQTCCFCGKVSEKLICEACKDKVHYVREPRCKKCGKPIRYQEQEFCTDCGRKRFHYEAGRSVWVHTGAVPWSIYQFKYHNRRIFAKFYAEEMYRLYGKKLREWGIDVIVPVPLHPKKKRMRGYNQAEILAKELSKLSGIPVESHMVKRIRYTDPQKKLDNRERRKNLNEAFEVNNILQLYSNVLIIDDIYTTGSTIDTIAKQLLEKCNKKSWFLTISIGQDF